MKINIFFRLSQTIKLALFLFTLLFSTHTAFAADPAPGQPMGACKSGLMTISCPGEQDCWDIKPFKTANMLSATSDNMCLPRINYPNCTKFDDTLCENTSGGIDQCVAVSSVASPSLYGMTCLSKNLVPQEKNSVDVNCATCGVYQQCVYIIPNNTDVWPRKRCINKDSLPPAVIEADGTCQTNASCAADEMCIFNTFEPQKYGFSCVKKAFITESPSCPVAGKNELYNIKAGVPCGNAGESKTCMYAIPGYKGPKPFTVGYRCVDFSKVAGGKFAPSAETCLNDDDCKTKNPEDPFCIANPITKKSQCFSQASIFTDMTTIAAQTPKCGVGADAKDCKCPASEIPKCAPGTNAENSICATYIGNGKITGQIACINSGNLGAGGATITYSNTPTKLAEQTYQAFAPKLQVDVPGLTFDGSITATDGPNGQKNFSIPYIATYINAVYKYAIGLGVLIAIIVTMYGGLRWMTSFGNAKAVSVARGLIGNAVGGLVLLLGVYSILTVINPDMASLKNIEIIAPKQEAFQMVESDEPDEDTPEVDSSGAPVPGTTKKVRLCDSFASCQKLCTNGGVNISAMNSAIQASGLTPPNNLIDPRVALTQYFSNCASGTNSDKKFLNCGIIFRGDDKETRVLPSVIKGLVDAATIAKESGYVLSIGSSYRSPEKQVAKVCTKMTKIPEGTKPCGTELACPGGSNHGKGFTIDVCLVTKEAPTKCLTPPTGSADSCANNTQKVLASTHLKVLNDVLFKAGWFKYCKELWHFEYTSTPVDGFRTKTY
jgi:D-alanyl-D-alanine dipeptidase